MKILNICVRIDKKSGGGSVAALEIARMLISKNHRVQNWIIIDKKDGELLDTNGLNVKFYKTTFNSSSYRFSIPLTRELKRKIKEYDMVLLSSLYLYPNTIASYYCNKFEIPYILFPQNSFGKSKLNHKKIRKTLYRLFLDNTMVKKAKLIHAANKEEKEEILAYDQKLNNIFIAPFGFSINFFSKKRSESLFEKIVPWDVNECKTILYVARIAKTKGLEFLIEAIERLISFDNKFRLLIVGPLWEADTANDLKNKFKDLLVRNIIHFAGLVDDDTKYACFQNSYLYVLPSFSENFGITVLEAISNKLVPIVTYNTPWSELEECNAGYRVTAGNSEEISKKILEYSKKSPKEQIMMKENAYRLAFKYDKASIAECFSELVSKKGV